MLLSESVSALIDIPDHSVVAIHPRPLEEDPEVLVQRSRTKATYRCPCGSETGRYWDSEEIMIRDLSLGRWKVDWLCFQKFRVRCPPCGIRTEELSWLDV